MQFFGRVDYTVLLCPDFPGSRFAGWCFDSKEAAGNTLIVHGHSLYFKTFFQMYLGKNVDHVAKKKKIVNAGECFLAKVGVGCLIRTLTFL